MASIFHETYLYIFGIEYKQPDKIKTLSMNNKTIISVVIPCYNHGAYLEETISSIEKNKGQYKIETIVVNDGSSDPLTLSVLNKIEKKNVRVLHQENLGLAKARNNGIALANGKYIIPLDSDNHLTQEYLTTAVDLMEKDNSIDIIYGDLKYIGERSGVMNNRPFYIDKMLTSNHIDACAIYRKSVWEQVNGYSEDMPYMGCEDWNFWLKAYNNSLNFHYLNKVCFLYRVMSDSMIRTTKEDFYEKTFNYNVRTLSLLYAKEINNIRLRKENMLSGNILKKTIKLVLNHFNKYKY